MVKSNNSELVETPYVRALSYIRQAPEGSPTETVEKLLREFLIEVDLELPKASNNKSRQKLYLATIIALIDYLNLKGSPHNALSAFHKELEARALGMQGDFAFEANVGRKSQSLEDVTRLALILAYYEAFPKERGSTYTLAKKYLNLVPKQVVQRAADARKGKNKRPDIENLRQWAKRQVQDPDFNKRLYFPDG